jgi:hypothetical protein
MKYEKPQIVFMASAMNAVQCTGQKRGGFPDNECPNPDPGRTQAAYEADE